MLVKERRIRRQEEFKRVYRGGKRAQTRFAGVHFLETGGVTRFGFSVGQKFSKKAVERNRAKRVLREAAQKLLPEVREGFDVIIVAKKGLPIGDLQAVVRELSEVLRKSGLLKHEEGKREK